MGACRRYQCGSERVSILTTIIAGLDPAIHDDAQLRRPNVGDSQIANAAKRSHEGKLTYKRAGSLDPV
jgi:hypothetical protein